MDFGNSPSLMYCYKVLRDRPVRCWTCGRRRMAGSLWFFCCVIVISWNCLDVRKTGAVIAERCDGLLWRYGIAMKSVGLDRAGAAYANSDGI